MKIQKERLKISKATQKCVYEKPASSKNPKPQTENQKEFQEDILSYWTKWKRKRKALKKEFKVFRDKTHAEKRMPKHPKTRAAEENDEKHETEGNAEYWKGFLNKSKTEKHER